MITTLITTLAAIEIFVIAAVIRVSYVNMRNRRTPAPLRGDWWGQFERQFRAHALRVADRASAGPAGNAALHR